MLFGQLSRQTLGSWQDHCSLRDLRTVGQIFIQKHLMHANGSLSEAASKNNPAVPERLVFLQESRRASSRENGTV